MKAKSDHMSDPELVTALRNGKAEAAFVQLYRQLPDVTTWIRNHGGTRTEARDIFQDALVILHEKVGHEQFTVSGTIAGFLFGICRNLWLAELRAKGRSEKHIAAISAETIEVEPTVTSPDEPLMQLAERAFATLGEKCRDLLSRFYISNEPLTAIAQAFGYAGEGAAKTRKYKCLEQARSKYRLLLSNTHTI